MNEKTPDPPVGLLGLGPMGAPIARRLLRKQTPLTVWNRTTGKAEPLVALGARQASTPANAAAPVVLTVLPDLVQVEELLRGDSGLLAGWSAGGTAEPVLVIHGTVSPTAVKDFARALWADHRVRVVDAPLSGGTIGAEEGTLSMMVGGDEETAAGLLPIFETYAATVRYLGPSGAGELAKACNQIIVAATVTAVSEAILLARRGGLDLNVLMELLHGGLADSEVLRQKGGKWIEEDFAAGGSAQNQLKDLRFILDAAGANRVELPLSRTVAALFTEMINDGDGVLDHTGIYRTLVRRSEHAAGQATAHMRESSSFLHGDDCAGTTTTRSLIRD